MNKPQVLIVENSVDFTGALNSALRSCELLKDHFRFFFLLPAASKAVKYVTQKGFGVYELPMKEIRRNAGSMLLYFPYLIMNAIRLIKLARTARIDLMVSNDFYNMILPVYKLMGGNIPYVCYVRFLPSRFPHFLVQCWCRLHDRYAAVIISVSEIVKRELPRQRKVVVISNELPLQPVDFIEPNSETILYPANLLNSLYNACAFH